jgi:cytoskeletal protein RodZ
MPGSWLAVVRESRGLSRDQLAGAIGVDVRDIVAIEGHDRARLPDEHDLRRVLGRYAEALGLEPNVFIREYLATPAPNTRPYGPMNGHRRSSGHLLVRWSSPISIPTSSMH